MPARDYEFTLLTTRESYIYLRIRMHLFSCTSPDATGVNDKEWVHIDIMAVYHCDCCVCGHLLYTHGMCSIGFLFVVMGRAVVQCQWTLLHSNCYGGMARRCVLRSHITAGMLAYTNSGLRSGVLFRLVQHACSHLA